jgi:hypothetical protein
VTSIPPKKLSEIVDDVADAVAFELGLPWRVKDLRVEALRAYQTATQRAARSGLSRKQVHGQMRPRIRERVSKTGSKMDALPPGQSKPSPEQIETALEAFSIRQWTPVEPSPPLEGWPIIEYRYGLMESVSLVEVEALLSYLRQNSGDLKQRFDARTIEAIEGRAIVRHTELSLPEDRSKLVCITDPYWANVLPDLAREANRRGRGHPTKGRSLVEELTTYKGLARHLTKTDEQTGREMNVSRHEVERWIERAEKLLYEQFAAEKGADTEEERAAAFIDYWTMIRKKYQREN